MNKKNILIIIICSFLVFLFYGCMLFSDVQSPVFLSDPVLTVIPDRAGAFMEFELKVQDNVAISKVELFADNSSVPFTVPLGADRPYGQKEYRGSIKVPAPVSDAGRFYEVTVKVYDTAGNPPVTRKLDKRLMTPDRNEPLIEYPKVNALSATAKAGDVYELSAVINDVGAGIKYISVTVDDINTFKPKILEEGSVTEGLDNYFRIIKRTSYSIQGELKVLFNLGVGVHTIKIKAVDNAGNPSKEITVPYKRVPDISESTPLIDYIVDPYIEPNADYSITIVATDTKAYITEIKLNDTTIPIIPAQPYVRKQIKQDKQSKIQTLSYTAKVKNLLDTESSVSFKVNISNNNPPLVEVLADNPTPNFGDIVNITVRATDDLGLSLVRVNLGSEKIAEYTAKDFIKDKTSGSVLNKSIQWTAKNGTFNVEAIAFDIKNASTSFKRNAFIKVNDTTPPVLNDLYFKVNVGGRGGDIRDILYNVEESTSTKKFSLAKGDIVRFYAQAWDKEQQTDKYSGVSKIVFRVSGGSSDISFDSIYSSNDDWFYSNGQWTVPEAGTYSISLTLTNLQGMVSTYDNYASIDAAGSYEDVYRPKIKNLYVNSTSPSAGVNDIRISDTVTSGAIFADDGKLKIVQIKFYKWQDSNNDGIVDSGEISDIRENPYQLKYVQSNESTNYGRQDNLYLSWIASTPGKFVASAVATNTLNLTNSATVTFEVPNQYLDIIKPEITTPPQSRQMGILNDFWSVEVNTNLESDLNVYLFSDDNGNGIIEETSETSMTVRKLKDLVDSKVITKIINGNKTSLNEYRFNVNLSDKDFLNNTKYLFEKTGRYRFVFEARFQDKLSRKSVDVMITDPKPPELTSITCEPTGTSTVAGKSTYKVYDRFYVPIVYSASDPFSKNKTDFDLTFKAIAYGNIDKAQIILQSGEVIEARRVSVTDIPDGTGRREYTFNKEIEGSKFQQPVESKFTIKLIKSDAGIGGSSQNVSTYDYYIVPVEFNRPIINNYEFALSSEINVKKSEVPNKTYIIYAGQGLNFNVYNLDVEDDFAIGGVSIYFKDKSGSILSPVPINKNTLPAFGNRKKIVREDIVNAFGADALSSNYTAPSKADEYQLIIRIKDRSYTYLEDANILDKFLLSGDVNYTEEIINVKVVDRTPPAVSISIQGNTRDIIETQNFYTIVNIDDKFDIVKPETINLFLIMPNGQKVGPLSPVTADKPYDGTGPYTLGRKIPEEYIGMEGPAKLYVTFDTIIATNVSYEKNPQDVIIDIDKDTEFIFDKPLRKISMVPDGHVIESKVSVSGRKENYIYDLKDSVVYIGYKKRPATAWTVAKATKYQDKVVKELGDLGAGIYDVYVYAYDYAGNLFKSSTTTFEVETVPPAVSKLIASDQDRNSFVFAFKTNQFFDEDIEKPYISITDNYGLFKVIAEFAVKAGGYGLLEVPSYSANPKVYNVYEPENPESIKTEERLYIRDFLKGAIAGADALINEGNCIGLRIIATDLNNNNAVFPYKIKDSVYNDIKIFRDNTAPADFSGNSNFNSTNYMTKTNNKVYLTVDDNVSVEKLEILTFSRDSGGGTLLPVGTKFLQNTIIFGANDWKYEAFTPPDNTEGIYDLVLKATDLAGNYRNSTIKINLDTKVPVLDTASFKVGTVTPISGTYYISDDATSGNISFNVQDRFISSSVGSVNAIIDGVTVRSLVIGSTDSTFKSGASIKISDVLISGEKDYTLSFEITDGAGNKSVWPASVRIKYDKSAPVLTAVSGTTTLSESSVYTSGTDAINVNFTTNETIRYYSVAYTRSDGNPETITKENVSVNTFSVSNILTDASERVVSVLVTDLAGNSKSYSYKVKK